MSNAKHTPGPWKTAGKEKRLIVDSESSLICSTSYSMNDYEGTLHVAQANARLIAAAPELLEALRPFARLLKEHHARLPDNQPLYGIGDSLITVGDMRRAIAAMAKAKGE